VKKHKILRKNVILTKKKFGQKNEILIKKN